MTKNINVMIGLQNNVTAREKPVPHNRMDNEICLILNCGKKVHKEYGIYYSLCKNCLKERDLGPYYRKNKRND